MPSRFIRQLLNNEKVIQQISESAPVRAAAKFLVRGAKTAEEKFHNLEISQKAGRIQKIYKEEYTKALKK